MTGVERSHGGGAPAYTGWRGRLPQLALAFATFLWGFTFLGTSTVMRITGPMLFVGVRFGIATLVLAIVFRPALARIGREEWIAAIAIGIPMAIGYILQAAGLQTIESSKSAFITALHVPIVPVLQWIIMRHAPRWFTWVGILCCLAGLILLSGPGALHLAFDRGEWLTIVSTVAIAVEIVLMGVFAPRVHVQAAAILQLGVVAIAAFAAVAITGEPVPDRLPATFWAITGAMAVASAVIQLLINWAQRTVSPTRATLIYTTEPVWAGIVGRVAGERLGPVALAGCGMILLGVLISEWRPFGARAEPRLIRPDGEPL